MVKLRCGAVYIGMFMSPHMEAGLALVRAVDSPPTVRSQLPPPEQAIAQFCGEGIPGDSVPSVLMK